MIKRFHVLYVGQIELDKPDEAAAAILRWMT